MNWHLKARKWMRNFRAGVLLAAALGGMASTGFAQRPNVEELLQRHDFVFIAERASGNAQPGRVLTPTYELRLTSDSVEGRLPFYGRVYSPAAAFSTAVEGFTIRSRLKGYELRKKRNGTWQLTVEALSGNNVQKLAFSISGDGSASFSVNSALRDMMFYEGRIASVQTP
jgi:hypothetical protein